MPDQRQICTPDSPTFASRLDVDEFAFITHSLGSRITTDGLERMTQVIETLGRDRPALQRVAQTAPVVEERCAWLEVAEDLR